MDFAALRANLVQADLASLSEEELRQRVEILSRGFIALFDAHLALMKQHEEASARLTAAQAEVRRLKGLPDPPDRSGPGKAGAGGVSGRPKTSSERERRRKKPGSQRGRHPRKARPAPTESVVIEFDRASLPSDAVRKGYRRLVKQDLVIQVRVVEMLLERWYSPSQRQYYRAAVPAGWEGGYGPVVKAHTLLFAHGLNQSQEPLLEFYQQAGLVISAGKLSGLVLGEQELFARERKEVLQAALQSSPWHQTDMTPTRVDGQAETCQVLGNPTYTHYETGPGHDRAAVIRMLRGGEPDRYLLSSETLDYLRARGWSTRRLDLLERHEEPFLRSRATLQRKIRGLLQEWSREDQDEFWTAALVVGYRFDPEGNRVRALLTDDASIYPEIAVLHPLCWIHELRHLKELQPQFEHYRWELNRVARQAWRLYRELDAYRASPHEAAVARLEKRFDHVFGQQVSYPELQAQLQRTLAKKDRLLLVLRHPELPLHNNSMELDARRRVRRRDVSFGPRTRQGARAWDIFQGLAATTKKLGVCYYDYLLDRITQTGAIPRLAELVKNKAKELELGRTWQVASPT